MLQVIWMNILNGYYVWSEVLCELIEEAIK